MVESLGSGRKAAISFIELYAYKENGHAPANLIALTRAAVADGLDTFVLAQPLPARTANALRASGAHIVTGSCLPVWLALTLHLLKLLHVALSEPRNSAKPRKPKAIQLKLLVRAMLEGLSVRAAGLTADGTIVILTASDALVSYSSRLANRAHIRVIHAVDHPEGSILRLLDSLSTNYIKQATICCPTAAVGMDVVRRYHHVAPYVQPFQVVEPDQRISDDEQRRARLHFDLASEDLVAVMIGGWQPYKDPITALAGLSMSKKNIVVIVAGYPIDAERAVSYQHERCRIIAKAGPVSPSDVRRLYAAASFSVVSRVRGEVRESGLVMDAAKFGVPLILSDNNPELVDRLHDASWARFFTAGDPASLADLLSTLDSVTPLPRPPETAPQSLGMLTPSNMVERFRNLEGG